ncbi:MAG: CPBP family intramembrane metalloprotease [Saprospiraceae bacterium]|nr:CPBP family intramembrane metalloprotease [Saprospiraceae bacterium]MCF8248424.1 CPBP family intramembrane metalloprotease [Saprospiraceae bacterium]MCF8280095.1 CPBP family intramembrane metalloprotease [Bacteroidales bacterium]MCF8309952.1 CPBP family intramembrane metalloprotease [Saprospiraceae bacterium]MCF8438717.1 CPBP family intramembrane metalloprotease [Saprospiraceae bacterium]
MFLQIARQGHNVWWRYLLSFGVIALGVLAGQMPIFLYLLAKGYKDFEISEMAETLNFERAGVGQNATLFFMLLAFVGGLVGLWFSVVFIHKKKFRWLFTPLERINWKKILFSFGLWMLLTVCAELIMYAIHPDNYQLHFQPDKFPGLLLVSLLIFPLQTSWEELMFRGYLMQGSSLLVPVRWISLLFTSALFGLMHMMNEEVGAFGVAPTMVYYIGTGLFLGIITLMDDSLELALGVHAATNIYSSLFVTFEASSLKTAALFEMKSVDMTEMLFAFFATAVAYTWIVAGKNHWSNWASRCLGSIQRQQIEQV